MDKLIDKLYKTYAPYIPINDAIKQNLIYYEYYFRQKFYGKEDKLTDELIDDIIDKFKHSLVDSGENVGMKASISIGAALTQSQLNAIHRKGGGVDVKKIVESTGSDRWNELLSGTTPKKQNKGKDDKMRLLTLRLIDDSYEATSKFANEQETFYFNEIWSKVNLFVFSKFPESIINFHSRVNFDNIIKFINPLYLQITININLLAGYNIHVVEIMRALRRIYPDIYLITGSIHNIREFNLYIFFTFKMEYGSILKLLSELSDSKQNNIVHGKYLKNCYVHEDINNKGHFILKANELDANSKSFENIILDPRINPYGSRSSDPNVNLEIFGINETNMILYDDIRYTAIQSSDTKNILDRHYKTLADNMCGTGRLIFSTRSSINQDNNMDLMRKIVFETPNEFINNEIQRPNWREATDYSSATFFGNLVKEGSGYSDIVLYPISD
jgi:hypothetical protein